MFIALVEVVETVYWMVTELTEAALALMSKPLFIVSEVVILNPEIIAIVKTVPEVCIGVVVILKIKGFPDVIDKKEAL